ncbi:hypothetical protein B0H14DRAFT_3591967 [Mycena olivaceomarginata]|nr:hypothetical protein B0H14DRAFT_3591967 [Mycena olivaceomarginata]
MTEVAKQNIEIPQTPSSSLALPFEFEILPFNTIFTWISQRKSQTIQAISHWLHTAKKPSDGFNHPRNDLADKIDSAASIDPAASKNGAQVKVIDAQARLFGGLLPDVLDLADAATRQANQVFAMLVGLKQEPAQFREVVNTRSNLEPVHGKCDAILFMSIPNRSHLSTDLEIIRHLGSSSVTSGQGSTTDDGVANYLASIDTATRPRDAGPTVDIKISVNAHGELFEF